METTLGCHFNVVLFYYKRLRWASFNILFFSNAEKHKGVLMNFKEYRKKSEHLILNKPDGV